MIEENPGERIAPGNKVLLNRSALIKRGSNETEEGQPTKKQYGKPFETRGDSEAADPLDERLKGDFDRPKPRYGSAGGNLYYGSLSNLQSVSGTLGDYSGSGLGGDLNGELWITKNWIFNGSYGFQSASLSGTAGSVGSSSWHDFSMLVGYRIFPEALAEGVTLTGSFGYQMMRFDLPSNSTLVVGGKRYGGVMLRADAEIAFMLQQTISVGFGIQPFSSFTELGPSLGVPSSGTVIGLNLAWNRQLMDSIWLKLGMRYIVANGSYENSATVANKRFAIGPGLYYLF